MSEHLTIAEQIRALIVHLTDEEWLTAAPTLGMIHGRQDYEDLFAGIPPERDRRHDAEHSYVESVRRDLGLL